MYKIFLNDALKKQLTKLSRQTQKEVQNIKTKLQEFPFIGDPLGYRFLREKRVTKGLRLYFLIYADLNAVLLLGISNKKTQQATIDEIHVRLQHYYALIQRKMR